MTKVVHSDEELRRWWNGLSKFERSEILGTMAYKMNDPEFALSLSRQLDAGRELSPKQLAAIRKWAP